jgi:hypothetical protein
VAVEACLKLPMKICPKTVHLNPVRAELVEALRQAQREWDLYPNSIEIYPRFGA